MKTKQLYKYIGVFVVSWTIGFAAGSLYVGGSKASMLADDLHSVKEDYDKVKEPIAKKGKEALDNVNTAEIGSVMTTEGKKLGHEAADGLRDIGRSWKDRLRSKTK